MRANILSAALLLIVAACGGDDDDSGASDADAGACTTTIKLQDIKFAPASLTLDSGKSVLCAVNEGQMPHDLVIRDGSKKDLGRTAILNGGQSARLTIDLAAGSYTMYCSVAGHEALGMVGPVTVR